MFFIIEEAKETVLDFSQRTVKVLLVRLRRMQLNAISSSDLIFISIK